MNIMNYLPFSCKYFVQRPVTQSCSKCIIQILSFVEEISAVMCSEIRALIPNIIRRKKLTKIEDKEKS